MVDTDHRHRQQMWAHPLSLRRKSLQALILSSLAMAVQFALFSRMIGQYPFYRRQLSSFLDHEVLERNYEDSKDPKHPPTDHQDNGVRDDNYLRANTTGFFSRQHNYSEGLVPFKSKIAGIRTKVPGDKDFSLLRNGAFIHVGKTGGSTCTYTIGLSVRKVIQEV
jgi:hypothetical protein